MAWQQLFVVLSMVKYAFMISGRLPVRNLAASPARSAHRLCFVVCLIVACATCLQTAWWDCWACSHLVLAAQSLIAWLALCTLCTCWLALEPGNTGGAIADALVVCRQLARPLLYGLLLVVCWQLAEPLLYDL